MAQLIQCKDCGNQISKNAKSCPNCGAKNKRTSVITWLALVFIGLPFLWSIFSGASNSSKPLEAVEKNSTTSASVEPLVVENWAYDQSKDGMRDSVTYYATNTSSNSIDLDFPYNGGTQLTIVIRNTDSNGNEIMLITDNGQLWCEYNNCYMSAKFDDGEVKRYPLAKAAAGSSETMFLDNSTKDFIQNLKLSKAAMIEIGFFSHGKQQFEFKTNGLDWQH
jgi:Zn finger protein HypA/HybF involved in hydrogenase expression